MRLRGDKQKFNPDRPDKTLYLKDIPSAIWAHPLFKTLIHRMLMKFSRREGEKENVPEKNSVSGCACRGTGS